MKFFYIFVTQVDIHSEVMKYSGSLAFENHALSDITFEKNFYQMIEYRPEDQINHIHEKVLLV